ncbi:MAG: M14 family metallopeptidase [Candidatus Methanofastidiosia archaeon]
MKLFHLIPFVALILSSASLTADVAYFPEAYTTYEEMVSELEEISREYSEIAKLYEIGRSVQNRRLLALKISDFPWKEEDEPEVFFVANHHAREVITTEVALYFIRYVVENYEKDERVTNLVDEREIWIVPMLNPDGHVMVENGKHDQRKNANGVDLNRNYSFMWGKDNIGSSPGIDGQTYRGPSPFSEPETQAIKNLVESREFSISISFHSGISIILFPWGYVAKNTPDDPMFREIASKMSLLSGYPYGNAKDRVIYLVNGEFDDWMYGEMGIISLTVEVYGRNSSNIWKYFNPPSSEIEEVGERNLELMLYVVEVSEELRDRKIALSAIEKEVVTQDVAIFKVNILNKTDSEEIYILNLNSKVKATLSEEEIHLDARKSKTIEVRVYPSEEGEHETWLKVISKGNERVFNSILLKTKFERDRTPPKILNLNILKGENYVVITWITDEGASYNFFLKDKGETIQDLEFKTEHQVELRNLESATQYQAVLEVSDEAGNKREELVDFKTLDLTPPDIQNLKIETSESSAKISFETSEISQAKISFETGGILEGEINSDFTTSHIITLENLKSDTEYKFHLVVEDNFGNQKTLEGEFKTKESYIQFIVILILILLVVILVMRKPKPF